ncbi:hypothetical protein SARC_10377, partial [Sphaeroforma arctica JP610]
RTTTLAEIKREITNRSVAIFEARSSLEKHLTDKATVATEQSTESGESTESCTPNTPTGEGNKRKADQIQSSVLQSGELLDTVDLLTLSPVSKRRRNLAQLRQAAMGEKVCISRASTLDSNVINVLLSST